MLLYQRTSRLAFSIYCLKALFLLAISQTQAQETEFDRSVSEYFENESPKVHLIEMISEDERKSGSSGYSGKAYTPIIFWHGMGDTAFGSINIDRLALQKKYPSIKVFSVQIGNSSFEDAILSYFSNVNDQIDQVCAEILRNEHIRRAKSLNGVGFSQGSQFLRGLVQRCPLQANGIRFKNLVTLGGQHQGVYGLPKCTSTKFCDYIRYMLSTSAYESLVQRSLVQAQYWHDPLDETLYRRKNLFLADINNERRINDTYRSNLLQLDNLVLVLFQQDGMVVPRESSLFGFYQPGQTIHTQTLEESPLYKEDRLGLKQLQESGRLKMISIPGRHLQYKISWFLEEIAAKYLDN